MPERKNINTYILDDDKLYINLLDYIFTKDIKYHFYKFRTHEECLSKINSDTDLLLLDNTSLSHDQFIGQARKTNPRIRLIAIVRDESEGEATRRAGADEFILKADGINKVISRIEDFLQKSEVAGNGEKTASGKRLEKTASNTGI